MKEPRSPCSRILWALVLPAALGWALSGCGGDRGQPVASLTATPERLVLPYGAFTELELGWRVTAQAEGAVEPLRVFLHLLDAGGALARTFDHDLPGPWREGREVQYQARIYQSILAPPLPPGAYTLTGGLYDGEGRRWPLDTEGERVGRDEYRLATLEVPSRGLELPTIEFSETWSPTLAGGDRQVVAFRWLSGDGTIRLRDLHESGTLWLGLRVPADGEGDLRRRILEPAAGGEGIPRVGIAVDCSGFEAQVSGEGHHDVGVPLTLAEEPCTVAFDADYVMDSPGESGRSLILEILAWKPAS